MIYLGDTDIIDEYIPVWEYKEGSLSETTNQGHEGIVGFESGEDRQDASAWGDVCL